MAERRITFLVTRRAKILGGGTDVVDVVQEATERSRYTVFVKDGVIGWVEAMHLETVK